MAGAYIEGMQGDDPKYLRCASTLKHFYGNNTEVGRGWKNSSIDPRNKYELYLEPFRRCIEESEVIEVVLADREEAKRILREENVAIMCSYHLMHFIHDEEPFAFLK